MKDPRNSAGRVTTRSNLSIQELRSQLKGQVIAPGDAGYDEARQVFYGGIDRHPAVIVRPATTQEVAYVVSQARETGLDLAVRSGGHSIPGYAVVEDGIVLDLSEMKTLNINIEQQTAWAETGLTAKEFSEATSAYGLAVGFGDTGSVGIGGITLGGGVGYLSRKHGLTIDSLLAAEVVTADGQILHADARNHPDLFWAIRGGGGNFGVATRFLFQLRDVSSIYGGMLILPATPENLAGFVAAAQAAPEELSGIANVMPAFPAPFIPKELVGQMVIMAMLVYLGDAESGAQAAAPFWALAKPLADMLRPMKYMEIYPPENSSYHPTAASRTMFMDRIELPEAEKIVETLRASDAAVRVAQIRVLGGAVSRVPEEATAYAHRQAPIMVNLAAFYNGPEDRAVREAWVGDFAKALDQGLPGTYVNFLEEGGLEAARRAYLGATWDRLRAIKSKYDPGNLFHVNYNIPPG